MAVLLHERIGQTLFMSTALNGLLAEADDGDIVFIDEIHELPAYAQTLLYKGMEERKIFVEGPGDKSIAIPTSDFCLIAATTDEYALTSALRDRFKIILPFSYYDVDSLATITAQRAQMMRIVLDPAVPPQIAVRARGTPRLAIRLLESCHRYARSRGDEHVTLRHFEETVAMEDIDSLGLGTYEQGYLQVLADRQGESVRLFTLEAALGVHHRTIQTIIEPFLIRAGLIERRQDGRVITQAGLRHLGLIAEPRITVA